MDFLDKWLNKIQHQEMENNLDTLQQKRNSLKTELKFLEMDMISNALETCNDNRTQAAKYLGISRELLIHKIKKHRL